MRMTNVDMLDSGANSCRSDYAFFMSYIQPPPLPEKGLWSDVEETERVNGQLDATKVVCHCTDRWQF